MADLIIKNSTEQSKQTGQQHAQTSVQVAKGASISFVGLIIGQLLKFILAFVIGRYLGARLLGTYSIAISVIELLTSIALCGMHGGIVKYLPTFRGDAQQTQKIIATALLVPFTVAMMIGLGLYYASPWLANDIFDEPQLSPVLRIMALGIPFYAIVKMVGFTSRAFLDIKSEALVRYIVRPGISLLLGSSILFLNLDIFGISIAITVSYILSFLIAMQMLNKKIPNLWTLPKLGMAEMQLVTYSLPIMIVLITTRLNTELNQLLVGAFGEMTDSGLYAAASKIGLQLALFLPSLDAVMSPMMAKAVAESDYDSIATLYKLSARWGLIVTAPLALVISLSAPQFLSLFGPEFAAGANILILLCLVGVIGAASGSNTALLQMAGYQKLDMFNNFVALLINIFVAIVLVDKYGAVGVAVGAVAAVLFANLIKFIEIYFLMGIHPLSYGFFKPLLSITGGFIGAYAAQQILPELSDMMHIIFVSTIFTLVYLVILWIQGLEQEDKAIFSAISVKMRLTKAAV